MKIIFNDASELQVQSISIVESGALKIKVLKATVPPAELKQIFSDPEKTKRITVQETGKTVEVYENYTQLEGIMAYTAGILEPILYKAGETPGEIIKRLQESNEKLETDNVKLNEQVEMLTQCILEMSEQVYQ